MEQIQSNSENKMLKAILQSIINGLIGCAIYIGIYLVGFIAFIGAYFIYFFAANGYKKVFGKIDDKGYWIIAIISFVELMISSFLGIVLVSVIKYEYYIVDAFKIIGSYCLSVYGLLNFFRTNIVAIIFLVIAAFSYKKREKKNNPSSVSYDYSSSNMNVNRSSTSEMTSSGTVVNDFTVTKNEEVKTVVNDSSANYEQNNFSDYSSYPDNYETAQTVEDLFKDLDDGSNNF